MERSKALIKENDEIVQMLANLDLPVPEVIVLQELIPDQVDTNPIQQDAPKEVQEEISDDKIQENLEENEKAEEKVEEKVEEKNEEEPKVPDVAEEVSSQEIQSADH